MYRGRNLGIHHYRPETGIVREGKGQGCAKTKGEEIIMALKAYTQQGELWGPSPDAVIPSGHVVRAINEIIESLGLDRLNRRYEHRPGEPAYDVRMLCKVILYAYSRGITSSREMGRQCEENLAFRFLTGGQCADHRTLSGFRRKKRHLLRWVFVKTVRLAREMGIAKLGLVAIDSVKFQADVRASSKQTADGLRELLRQLDGYFGRLEEVDQREDQQFGEAQRGDELPEKLQSLQRRREKLAAALEKLQQDQRRQREEGKSSIRRDVFPADPEAVWVKKQGRIIAGYSGQVAADGKSQIIVGVKATVEADDSQQLNPMLEEVEKTAGQPAEQAVLDNGYYSDEAVLQASQSPTQCFVPGEYMAAGLNNHAKSGQLTPYHSDRFGYDEERDYFICPEGKRLRFFKNHQRRGSPTVIYRGTECKDCPACTQCTADKKGYRTIEVHREHKTLREARELLQSEEGRKIYKRRKAIIEPVFGQWQHNLGIRRLRLRGLMGFSIELLLMAIAHNIKKIHRHKLKLVPCQV